MIKRLSDYSAVAMFVLCGIFLLMALLPENGWWGINHLYFLPRPAQVGFALILVLALLPQTRRLLSSLGRMRAAISRRMQVSLVVIVSVILFFAFRMAVHSLGDGYQRAYQIEFGKIFYSPEMLDFAVHALLYRALTLISAINATTVIAGTSIAAGAVYLMVLNNNVSSFPKDRVLLLAGVFSLGCSQFFFGYVESYTLVLFFSVWFVFLAVRSREENVGFWNVSAVYLLAGFSHQVALILFPAYLYLVFGILRNSARRYLLSAAAVITAILPYAVPKIINVAIGKSSPRSPTDYFLPFAGDAGDVISMAHLHGIVNEFLLVAPIFIMLLPLLLPAFFEKKNRLLLLCLCLPAALFILLFNPELPIPRDWDLLAVPAAIAVVPVLILSFKKMKDWPHAARSRTLTAVSASLIMLAAWVAVNSSTASNLQRAEYLLKQSPRGQRYGYEQLAFYYSQQEDFENELRMLMLIKPEDRTSRVYAKLSQSMYTLGQYREAYEYARKGVTDSLPGRLAAFMAGLTAYDAGEYWRSVYYLQYAVAKDRDNYEWICKLGDALMKVDSVDAAMRMYGRAMSLDPSHFRAYVGLGEGCFRKDDYRQARSYCEAALQRNPRSPRARSLWELLESSTTKREDTGLK